jgi:hypothetical protein
MNICILPLFLKKLPPFISKEALKRSSPHESACSVSWWTMLFIPVLRVAEIILWDNESQNKRSFQNINYKSIYFYRDNTHHLFVMYLIIRCPSCRTFAYVDNFQKWKLCPMCGHADEVVKAPAYLEVEDYIEAEHIVKQMEKHLQTTKKPDFSPEETAELRHHYTEALRKRAKRGHIH